LVSFTIGFAILSAWISNVADIIYTKHFDPIDPDLDFTEGRNNSDPDTQAAGTFPVVRRHSSYINSVRIMFPSQAQAVHKPKLKFIYTRRMLRYASRFHKKKL
jgi:hypothetical protein